jgi:Xaa-Pro aminopeptidase
MNYILRDESAVYHECGFSCDNVVFLKFGSEAFFITDSRYDTEAKESIKGAEVIITERRDMFPKVRELIQNAKAKELIFDPSEWTLFAYEEFTKELDSVVFKRVANFSQQKRIVKSSKEIDTLQRAAKIGAKAFDSLAEYLSKSGLHVSEQRLHFEAQSILKNFGEFGLSFSPIFAIDKNAAKCHALPLLKSLEIGNLILFDAGITYKRYCSDRTRTAQFDENLNFSKAQKFSDLKRQKIYDIVLKSQEAGIKKAKAGIKACEVDRACRDVIEASGYGKYFIHSTGHGVGLDVHELPVISSKSETVLEEGMVFTVEPGIYLPNEFGVRIEDTLVITNANAKILG